MGKRLHNAAIPHLQLSFSRDDCGTKKAHRLGELTACTQSKIYSGTNLFETWNEIESEFKLHPEAERPMPSYAAMREFSGALFWRGLLQLLSVTEQQ